MATYLILNGIVTLIVLIVLRLTGALKWTRDSTATLLVILLATAIFDSLIVGLGIVAYDPSLILGVYVGHAPVEDFFYAVVAVILVPNIWKYFGTKDNA
ncbi:MAG TPA: lycopene cyclase domain-containing protein [Patescibacteria group bacterium]|jgi:lycopene cyclase domain-containing protein|nr:lycopene cyclase domain-containing protein [Patescibacteria group bacterium]